MTHYLNKPVDTYTGIVKRITMKTTTVEGSAMQSPESLEAQYAAARDNDFVRCISSLEVYGFKLVGLCQKNGLVIMRSGDWTVEVNSDALVKTEGSDKSPVDFNTWQLHNFSRLLDLDAE